MPEKLPTNSAKLDMLLTKVNSLLAMLNSRVTEEQSDEPKKWLATSELLAPCPFCGGNPVYVVDPVDGICIMCYRCRIRTPGYFDNRPRQTPNAITLARKTWNARCTQENTKEGHHGY